MIAHNSVPRQARLNLKTAQLDRDTVQATLDAARGRAELSLYEADERFAEEFGQPLDPQELFDFDPNFQFHAPSASARIGDRKGGQNFPFYRNEIELSFIRASARLIATTSEIAIGILENLANYVIGPGFETTAVARAKQSPEQELIDTVNEVLDEFDEENKWTGVKDTENFNRSRRDGEAFLALFHVGGGHAQARFVDPEQVTEPGNQREIEEWIADNFGDEGRRAVSGPTNWEWGIHTAEGDIERVFGYHVKYTQDDDDWDYIPASRMEHIKLNVDSNIKRGLSDFYPVRKHMRANDKLLTALIEGSATCASIAYVRQFPLGATSDSIQDTIGARSMVRRDRNFPTGTQREDTTLLKPGSVLNVPAGMEYKPGPLSSQRNPAFIAAMQAGLRAAGVRWNLPESVVSGDASGTNFASALVAEGPATKAFEKKQRTYVTFQRSLFWKVIRIAHEAGRFDSFGITLAELRKAIELEIEPPTVAVRDLVNETTVNQILKQNGILSPRTWAGRESLDYDQEIRNGAKELAGLPPGAGVSPTAQLRPPSIPTNQGPARNGAGLDAEPASLSNREGAIKEALYETLISMESPPEAKAALIDALEGSHPFDETKIKRDEAGKFSDKEGLVKKKRYFI